MNKIDFRGSSESSHGKISSTWDEGGTGNEDAPQEGGEILQNEAEINRLIEGTPAISRLQKDFYQMMIAERKEKILDYSKEF